MVLTWWYLTGNTRQRVVDRLLSYMYRKTSNISRTLVGNKIVDNSDVVGASPVGAAPTTSSFSTEHLALMDWAKTTARGYKKHWRFGIWCDLYQRFYGMSFLGWSTVLDSKLVPQVVGLAAARAREALCTCITTTSTVEMASWELR